MALRNKDLISIHDLSVGEVATILDVSRKLKKKQKLGEPHEYLKGKTLAMIFSKASTRTRVSFETGFHQLGGHPIYMSEATSQIGRGGTGEGYSPCAVPFCGWHHDPDLLP